MKSELEKDFLQTLFLLIKISVPCDVTYSVKGIVAKYVCYALGILSVNSFVVHDGGSDETSTDLIGTNLCGRLNVINKTVGPLFGKWQLTL